MMFDIPSKAEEAFCGTWVLLPFPVYYLSAESAKCFLELIRSSIGPFLVCQLSPELGKRLIEMITPPI
jgi:hypothetical protein